MQMRLICWCSFINRTIKLAASEHPSVDELSKILCDAKEKGVPTDAITDAFEEHYNNTNMEDQNHSGEVKDSVTENEPQSFDNANEVDRERSIGDYSSPPSMAHTLSQDSDDSGSVFNEKHLDDKFSSMEHVDDSEEIGAFLTRFAQLKAGGHFPDANVDALEMFQADNHEPDAGEVEIDLVHGFVNKNLSTRLPELSEEEKLWSQQKEEDIQLEYANFLKKQGMTKPEVEYTDFKQQIAELRDVDNGDAEVYLMEESVVEVAFVDEEEEMRATEKSRNKQKWDFTKDFKKSMHREENVVLGRKVPTRGKSTSRSASRTTYFSNQNKKIAALEKMFEEREERIIREDFNMISWKSPWEKRWITEDPKPTHVMTRELRPEVKSEDDKIGLNDDPLLAPSAIDGVAAAAAFAERRSKKEG
mmetsp:Transcript_47885/g.72414  ORF Transcript_47885/g.72414 Transcript_47885/m.72414 type:complete len:418 (+) Transcript_47885:578-1831(+)